MCVCVVGGGGGGEIVLGGKRHGGQLSRGGIIQGAVDLGGNFPGGELTKGKLVGGNSPGETAQEGIDLQLVKHSITYAYKANLHTRT